MKKITPDFCAGKPGAMGRRGRSLRAATLIALYLLASALNVLKSQCNSVTYAVASNNCGIDYISHVSFATINFSSTCNSSFSVNTSTIPVVMMGQSYTISTSTGGDVEGVRAWIDYNIDGTFNNTAGTELILGPLYAGTNPATYTAVVTIPVTATPGFTRLRVRCNYAGAPADATTSQTWGETEDYCIQIVPATPCNGAPTINTIVSPTYAICPNSAAPLGLASTYTVGGISYAWFTSPTSSLGPWTPITGTTPAVSVPNQTATSYFMAVTSCSSGGSTSMTPVQVTVSAVITNTPPYLEDFEGLPSGNKLPNCSWSSSSTLGINQPCQTYIQSNTMNRMPNSGSKFASFYYSPAGTNYFYSNGIYLTSGITYSAAIWWTSEAIGYNNWSDLRIMLGQSQSTTGLVTIASTNGPAVSNIYKLLSNTFTVATTGIYYVAIRATCVSGSAQYLTWDDLSVTIPCQPGSPNNPTLTLAPNATTICAGETANLSVSGADTYTWSGGEQTSSISNELYYNETYEVVGTNALTGCTSNISQGIVVNPSPSILLITNKTAICAGESLMLTALGGITYTWSGGSTSNANVITVSPTSNTTYSVWGANSFGCSKMATQAIVVNPLPTLQVTSTAPSKMCVGEKHTLSATGAAAFSWVSNTSPVVLAGANVAVSPNSTTTYTVSGTDINGCTGVTTFVQNVETCTGLAEQLGSVSGLMVYPNPGSGEYTLEFQNVSNSANIEVLDLTGKVILRSNIADSKTSINLTSFANGIYFLKLQSEGSVNIVKLIKQ